MLAAGIIFSILASLFGGWSLAARPPEVRFHADRVELRTGYGYQYKSSSRPNNFQLHPVLASVAVPLTEETGPSWLRGRVEWNPELFLGLFTHPYDRPLIGVTPIQLKYTLAPKGRFTPYAVAGSGVLYANINRRETRSDWNFNLNWGAGSTVRLSGAADLILEYRHVHISNADIHEDNTGINAHTFLAGVSIKR